MSQEAKAPKNANVIILVKEGAAEDVLVNFALFLRDHGYSIENLDKELLSLSTEYREFKASGAGELKIKAYTEQEGPNVKIVIRGSIKMANPFGSPVSFEACNCGIVGDNRKRGFNTIMNLVLSFPFDTFSFAKD